MAWDEWEQAKTRAQQDASMQLNQVAPERGGGSGDNGDLIVHNDVLGALGNLAYGLRQQFLDRVRPRPAEHLRRVHPALQRRTGHGLRPDRTA